MQLFGLHGMIVNGMAQFVKILSAISIAQAVIRFSHQESKEELIFLKSRNIEAGKSLTSKKKHIFHRVIGV